MLNKYLFLLVVFSSLLLSSCDTEPDPILYGKDNCEHCMMLISDIKYGAELITQKGKIYKFDSIECLAAYSDKLNPKEIHSMWVVNFSQPNELINVDDSYYLLSDNLKSPMGLFLSAYKDEEFLTEIKKQYGGKKLTWNELVNYVKAKWN